jgi:hypothetical protein
MAGVFVLGSDGFGQLCDEYGALTPQSSDCRLSAVTEADSRNW